MPQSAVTLYTLAERYIATVLERPGADHHPLIQWWLSLCGYGFDAADEIPWCSAFVNGMAWELRLPRSKSAAARSWLTVGQPVGSIADAIPAFDVVVLTRGAGVQPGPEVLQAPGHVGIFAGRVGGSVSIVGGNQANTISVAVYPWTRVLGVRRLYTPPVDGSRARGGGEST